MNEKKNINIKIDDPQIVPFILGVNNNTLNLIESIIGVELDSTGDIITVSGTRDSCLKAKVAIEELYTRIKEAKNFNIENLDSLTCLLPMHIQQFLQEVYLQKILEKQIKNIVKPLEILDFKLILSLLCSLTYLLHFLLDGQEHFLKVKTIKHMMNGWCH